MSTPHLVLLLVALQRLAELAYARHNTRRLLAAGGVEVGRGHYPLFILLHGGWLAAMAVLVPGDAMIHWPLLVAFVLLQAIRVWTLATLGRYWTTRIITVRGAPLVHRGPYRVLRHPNYLVVALEVVVLPLAFGAHGIALVFGTLNLALLAHRIRVESLALQNRRGD